MAGFLGVGVGLKVGAGALSRRFELGGEEGLDVCDSRLIVGR